MNTNIHDVYALRPCGWVQYKTGKHAHSTHSDSSRQLSLQRRSNAENWFSYSLSAAVAPVS